MGKTSRDGAKARAKRKRGRPSKARTHAQVVEHARTGVAGGQDASANRAAQIMVHTGYLTRSMAALVRRIGEADMARHADRSTVVGGNKKVIAGDAEEVSVALVVVVVVVLF